MVLVVSWLFVVVCSYATLCSTHTIIPCRCAQTLNGSCICQTQSHTNAKLPGIKFRNVKETKKKIIIYPLRASKVAIVNLRVSLNHPDSTVQVEHRKYIKSKWRWQYCSKCVRYVCVQADFIDSIRCVCETERTLDTHCDVPMRPSTHEYVRCIMEIILYFWGDCSSNSICHYVSYMSSCARRALSKSDFRSAKNIKCIGIPQSSFVRMNIFAIFFLCCCCCCCLQEGECVHAKIWGDKNKMP